MTSAELLALHERIERLSPSRDPERFVSDKSAIMATVMRAVRSLQAADRGLAPREGARSGSVRSFTFPAGAMRGPVRPVW